MEYTQSDLKWAEGELKSLLDFLLDLKGRLPQATNEIDMTIKALADNERFTAADWFGAVLATCNDPDVIAFHDKLIVYLEGGDDE